MNCSHQTLAKTDPDLAFSLQSELVRQQNQIELIASENIVSQAILEAQGSILTNKYAEGYPGRRYYGGCEFVDIAEKLAIDRVKQIFQCGYANVQSHSGAQANQAVMVALLQPGDTILGLSLAAGGHLTHGSSVSISGRWFKAVSYGVDPVTHLINEDEVEKLAHEHRPKLIIAGGSAYPRVIDFARFRAIADAVGAHLLVDMAHFAGLVAGGVYPSPIPHAHVVTSTTHKTLRGPRGAMIFYRKGVKGTDKKGNPIKYDLEGPINFSVFPGLQGGPLMHVIAAKAVAFKEALQPEFKEYATSVVNNAKALAETLVEQGFSLVSGGTDSHVLLVDLQNQNVNGKQAEEALERCNITCNKNGIPFDPLPPMTTSGIRLGSPAATTRGFGVNEFKTVGLMISEIISSVRDGSFETVLPQMKVRVSELCERFPIYPTLRYL